jgi:hypothetical protein
MVRGVNTPQKPENDIHYADTQHPVEHIVPSRDPAPLGLHDVDGFLRQTGRGRDQSGPFSLAQKPDPAGASVIKMFYFV